MKISKGKLAWIIFLVVFVGLLAVTIFYTFIAVVTSNFQTNGWIFIFLFIVIAAFVAVIFYVTTSSKMIKRISKARPRLKMKPPAPVI